MTSTLTAKPPTWHKATGVNLISYDSDSVWTLDIQLETGERMGVELSKLAVLALSTNIAEWKEWVKSSPTGRRGFASRNAK
jgi:hypothetical protein